MHGTDVIAKASSENRRRVDLFAIVLLGLITALDLWVRTRCAWENTNFVFGDALAPFSLLDQVYHGELIDLSRQSWLLPMMVGKMLRLWSGSLGYQDLFGAYATVIAVFSSSSLPLTYLLARRFCGPLEALIPVGVLAVNASFFLHSVVPNPTQAYSFFFLATLVALDRRRMGLAIALAAIGVMVRWEGALLLVLLAAYLAWNARAGLVPSSWAWAGPLAALGTLAAILVVHVVWSSTPFGFLINTNAARPPLTLLSDPTVDRLQLLAASLAWKFEKLPALAVNMTLAGLVLAVIGGTIARRSTEVIVFAAVYWLGYEGVMLVYTLVLPVGNISGPTFSEVLSTAPVARYYQVFSPFLSILAYVGLRGVTSTLGRFQPVFATLVLGLFAAHQLVVARNTYVANYYSFGRGGFVGDIIGAAESIRSTGARGVDVVLARTAANGLEAVDVLQGDVGGYQLHSFHFSVIAGRNRTNCTGYNLENPNLFCSVLAGTKVVDPDHLPLGGEAAFLVLAKPGASANPAGFQQIYENGTFVVYQRRASL